MAEVGDKFVPGRVVPDSGLYECDAVCDHQWSTDVKGRRIPPLPVGCGGKHWVLRRKRP